MIRAYSERWQEWVKLKVSDCNKFPSGDTVSAFGLVDRFSGQQKSFDSLSPSEGLILLQEEEKWVRDAENNMHKPPVI